MKLDIKNNQSEIKEVQDIIMSDKTMLVNADEVVKADSTKKYLMGINIPIGQFSTEVPKELKNSFIQRYDIPLGIMNTGLGIKSPLVPLGKQVGVELQNNIFITLELGTGLAYFEHKAILDKTLDSKEKDYKHSYLNRCSKILSELMFDIKSIADTTANRKKVKKIFDTVDKIENKLACKYELKGIVGAQLCIHSGLTIAELLQYDKSFLDSLSEELTKINEGFDEIDIDAYIKTYATRKPVNAMNLIKIIKKGTDTKENLYTGKCDGIVVEVLTALENKSIFSAGELGIHKKFLNPGFREKSRDYEGFGSGTMRTNPIMTQTVNNNIYMTSVKSELKIMEEPEEQDKHNVEMDISISFGDEVAHTEFKQNTSIRMKDASSDDLARVFGKPIEVEKDEEDAEDAEDAEMFASMFDTGNIDLPEAGFERLVNNSLYDTFSKSEILFDMLILPENINLSESFKAKYI